MFLINKANDGYDICGQFFKFIQITDIFIDKSSFKKQILWWIPGNGKLGKYYYVHVSFFCFFDMGSNNVVVSFKVSNDRIYLCQVQS